MFSSIKKLNSFSKEHPILFGALFLFILILLGISFGPYVDTSDSLRVGLTKTEVMELNELNNIFDDPFISPISEWDRQSNTEILFAEGRKIFYVFRDVSEYTTEDFVGDGRLQSWHATLAQARLAVDLLKRKNSGKIDLQNFKNFEAGNFHALLIGNNEYDHLEDLESPIQDINSIGEVLAARYDFQVTQLLNATRKDILGSLNKLRKTLNSEDNLVIYYAGHGAHDETLDEGYWQPVNALIDDDTDWIPIDRITRILRGFKSNNVLVMADSCYAGMIFRGSDENNVEITESEVLQRLLEKRTRVAITSGGLEPVVDNVAGQEISVFAKSVLDTLTNNNLPMTATQLFLSIQTDVIPRLEANGIDQTPEYRSLFRSGHDGGDFVFIPKQ